MSELNDVDMTETTSSTQNGDLRLNQSMQVGLDRYTMFNIVMENALESISSGFSEEEYVNLFGNLSIFKKNKSIPMKMQKRMKMNVFKSMSAEINSVVLEEKLKEKLQKLDKIVEECECDEGEEQWRPNGNVNDHIRSCLIQIKMTHNGCLEKYVRGREQSTERLQQTVKDMRANVVSMEMQLQHFRDYSVESSAEERVNNKITERVEEF